MKKLIIALFIALPLGVFAQQDLKIGYINKQELISSMPEYTTAMKQLEDMNLKYITEGKKLQEEFQKKYQEYAETQDSLDATIKKYKESELMRLQQSIEEFSKSAEENLKKKQQELVAPIVEKMDKAIKQVGDENGFTYIIDNSAGIISYTSAKSINVLPFAKKALNIQ